MTDVEIQVYSNFDDAKMGRKKRTIDKSKKLDADPTTADMEDRFKDAYQGMAARNDNISDNQRDWRANFAARHRI